MPVIETTPELAGVGCEMCHGPGGTYTQDGYMTLKNKEYKRAEIVAVGMTDEITAETCAVCHNTESPFVGDDYVFDFESRSGDVASRAADCSRMPVSCHLPSGRISR